MRIFKYWVIHTKKLKIGNGFQSSKVFGGSNISKAEAIIDADVKFENAQKIIDGLKFKDDDYEADIIEEIHFKIDNDNIITRNRYGALVLNSAKQMFIDIDDYDYSLSDLFFRRKMSKKDLMLKKIQKSAKKAKYSHLGFRVYETFKGFRVIVTNEHFSPRDKKSKEIMKEFNADYLYRWLCIKQNCYRARLTPKPFRIKQKGIKVIFPNRTESQQIIMNNWKKEYNLRSKKYSTCNLVWKYGNSFSNRIIDFHDKESGVFNTLKLA